MLAPIGVDFILEEIELVLIAHKVLANWSLKLELYGRALFWDWILSFQSSESSLLLSAGTNSCRSSFSESDYSLLFLFL